MNDGEIIPIEGSQDNEIFILTGSNYSFQIDIVMVDNPGGDDDDDDGCNCDNPL